LTPRACSFVACTWWRHRASFARAPLSPLPSAPRAGVRQAPRPDPGGRPRGTRGSSGGGAGGVGISGTPLPSINPLECKLGAGTNAVPGRQCRATSLSSYRVLRVLSGGQNAKSHACMTCKNAAHDHERVDPQEPARPQSVHAPFTPAGPAVSRPRRAQARATQGARASLLRVLNTKEDNGTVPTRCHVRRLCRPRGLWGEWTLACPCWVGARDRAGWRCPDQQACHFGSPGGPGRRPRARAPPPPRAPWPPRVRRRRKRARPAV
jgi:hypothetical protein